MKSLSRWLLPAAMLLAPLIGAVSSVHAAQPGFQGKKLLYVLNLSEVERFRSIVPPRPERLKLQENVVADDQKAIAHLKKLGFDVAVTDEHSGVELAEKVDLVFIAESVGANYIQGKYKYVTVPVVVLENDLDDLGMTAKKLERDFGTLEKERFVWLVNAPHRLAGDLTAGIHNVYESTTKMNWGKPGPGSVIVATIAGETDKAVIFAYPCRGTGLRAHIVAQREAHRAVRAAPGVGARGKQQTQHPPSLPRHSQGRAGIVMAPRADRGRVQLGGNLRSSQLSLDRIEADAVSPQVCHSPGSELVRLLPVQLQAIGRRQTMASQPCSGDERRVRPEPV